MWPRSSSKSGRKEEEAHAPGLPVSHAGGENPFDTPTGTSASRPQQQQVLNIRPLDNIPAGVQVMNPSELQPAQLGGARGAYGAAPGTDFGANGRPGAVPVTHPVTVTPIATPEPRPGTVTPPPDTEQPLQQPRGAGKGLKGFIQLLGILLHWVALTALVVYELIRNVQLIRRWDVDWVVRRVPQDPNAGDPGIQKERNIFWILMLVTGIAGAIFFIMDFALLVVGQLRAIVRRYKFNQRRTHMLLVWIPTIIIILSEFTKLIVLQSFINKMRYQGLWCDSGNEKEEIKYAFQPDETPATNCRITPLAEAVKFAIILALTQVGFNTIIFFAREPRRIVTKVMALLPAIMLTALLWVKPVTSMMLFAFSQRYFIDRGNFNFSAEMIVTLISLVLAVVLSLMMGYVLTDLRLVSRLVNRPLACCHLSCPEYDAKALESARPSTTGSDNEPAPKGSLFSRLIGRGPSGPPRPLTIRRAIKLTVMQLYYIGQLPIAFGLVAPIVVYVSLRIWNFWVALDLIVGAALMLIILLVVLGRCFTRDRWME